MAVEQLTISDEQLLDKLGTARERLLREIRKAIIGQDEVVEQVLLALFVGGHSIITGVPGLAKTLLVRTIANVLDLTFKRIQFTPDLMPADITGTEIIEEDRARLAAKDQKLRSTQRPAPRHPLIHKIRRGRCSRTARIY
jgi:MoxR-like ATPase